jgi:hypothetical protein
MREHAPKGWEKPTSKIYLQPSNMSLDFVNRGHEAKTWVSHPPAIKKRTLKTPPFAERHAVQMW